MPQRIFLSCSSNPIKNYLRKHYQSEPFLFSSPGTVFESNSEIDLDKIYWMIKELGPVEIIQVHDMDSVFLTDIILDQNEIDFPGRKVLSELYHNNTAEVQKEAKTQSKVGVLALLHMESQAQFLMHHKKLSELYLEGLIQFKGLLTQLQKNKSIEFELEFQHQPV